MEDDSSVITAATSIAAKYKEPLYGLVNNAGVGFGYSVAFTLGVNYYGPKRVCKAFIPLLDKTCGRIVNIASASGPMFLAQRSGDLKTFFSTPDNSEDELEAKITELSPAIGGDAYGFSKACLNTFTMQLAKSNPELLISSATPGFINTDLTAGMGASGTPEQGARSTLFCLFSPDARTGCYYGSDSVRSPLTAYRGPGDPPYNP